MKKFSITVYTKKQVISDNLDALDIGEALNKFLSTKKIKSSKIKSCLIAPIDKI